MKQRSHYCIILAGGGGKRLWPLSRERKPKQFLTLEGDTTLLEMTLNRLEGVTTPERCGIVALQEQKELIEQSVGNAIGFIIEEPARRNTAPALFLSCLRIYEKDPDAVITFLPADHFVRDPQQFADALKASYDYVCDQDVIALLGLQPTHAATGYGYIECDKKIEHTAVPLVVQRFHEKPEKKVAEQYCASGKMLWNIGVFTGRAATFIDEYQTYVPTMVEGIKAHQAGTGSYDAVEDISVDYAIMERSKRTVVFPAHFGWTDIGNLDTFLGLCDQRIQQGSVAVHDAQHNRVYAQHNKLVALIGVNDLAVVDTDDVLLIVARDRVEEVKKIVEALKTTDLKRCL